MKNIFKKSYLAITLTLAGIIATSTMSTALVPPREISLIISMLRVINQKK
ncbi:hypothetical protein Xbud_02245 [Xenorhabdus budapestensis]|uniref:Uncharacterized protein n=1 Tax=Xenorhabdus budapestensis TaxID=290110 RepID=A0A2D0J0A3_XENBU|nr:hypothetical protein Xbud_02245 [Xenorhabdus budapestensis]